MAKKKKLTWAKNYQDYLNDKAKLKLYQKVGIGLLIWVIAGTIGWFWEFLLAEIAGGFTHLYIKGGNLLPWMNIYAYGAILIILTTYKIRRYPWLVLTISTIGMGLFEWFAGWLVYTVGDGTRYWNYDTSWFGFGNINGFVCPASAFTFGLGAMALMYFLLPLCIKISRQMSKQAFLTLTISLFTIIMLDDITNLTLKNLNLPTAQDLYLNLGWQFKQT